MEHGLHLNIDVADIPFALFADDEDEIDAETEDLDSLDEDLESLESDDDPGIEWRNDGEYEE